MASSSARRKPAPSSDTVSGALRAKSDYSREKGYSPFYHAFLADLPRLCSGASCWALVLTALMESLGRARDRGEAPPEWTKDLDKHWLATVCHTDKRTVDRDLKYLETSGMAQIRHTIRNMVCIRLCFRDWPTLPDYAPPDRFPEKKPEPEDNGVDAVRLLRSPCRVRVGQCSAPIQIEHPVSSFQLRVDGEVDLSFTAEIKSGKFLVTTKALSVSNQLQSPARHKGPEPVNPKGEHKEKGEVKANHPRADELARLFDPLLLRCGPRSLSADTVAFSASLAALGDLPNDFLVKFVVQRAERPISSPKVCPSIVKEAVANWQKVKNLPAAQQLPPASRKGPRSFAESIASEVSRRVQKYGKVI